MIVSTSVRHLLQVTLILCFFFSHGSSLRTWLCENNKCTKNETANGSEQIAMSVCKLTCLPNAGLWPYPTGNTQLASEVVTINPDSIEFSSNELPPETSDVLERAKQVFLSRVRGAYPDNEPVTSTDNDRDIAIRVEITNGSVTYFTTDVDESYFLTVTLGDNGDEDKVLAVINAQTFVGARHGLETLAQLIVYDDLNENYKILRSASIQDKPVYRHRGIGLDTARSYFPVDSILKIIDGLSQNKLNSLHWHITDTHSFPYVSEKYPEMSESGAYSKQKVYTRSDIGRIVQYARIRGVRVTPELDAPAHVGEGWQALLNGSLTTCFRWLPWTSYCVEPPCGQFDPTQEQLYPILADLYREWSEVFVSDLFHMGGDEVNMNCWQSTPTIQQYITAKNITLIQLWDEYQEKAKQSLRQSQPNVTPLIWTNTLTEQPDVVQHLDPSEYLIQVWSAKTDQSIAKLINQGYRLLFSNYDELYFDCGGAAWIGGPGQNWCSPYIGWQSVYRHNPEKILSSLGVTVTDAVRKQIVGSEAALWTEQLDEGNVEGRYFPRVAALAERLWSNPDNDWTDAQYRMNNHRERLSRNGLKAELLQPAWCLQNDGQCGEN